MADNIITGTLIALCIIVGFATLVLLINIALLLFLPESKFKKEPWPESWGQHIETE